MPHSLRDLHREMEGMNGLDFSLFPSETVRTNMASAQVVVSASQVDRLWDSYQKATIGQGLKPYSKAGGGAVSAPLLNFMSADTGYSKAIVAAFLNAVEYAVTVQGWEWRWLDPAGAKAAGEPMTAGAAITDSLSTAGNAVGAFLKPTLDPVTNLVKYAAVALVAGAVIYGVYKGSKMFRKRKGK